MKKKKVIIIIIVILLICLVALGTVYLESQETEVSNTENLINSSNTEASSNSKVSNSSNNVNSIETSNNSNTDDSTDITVVATLLDTITSNSAWCATFQLIWNDMQNEIVKQDIDFSPQSEVAKNLNKQTFTEDDISDEYYYKTYGLMTRSLKEEIEEGIEEKFDQTSDILDSFDWSSCPEDDSGYENSDTKQYFLYTMLYREFNFNEAFDVLYNDEFEGTEEIYDDVEYFGIDASSSSSLYSQVDVLYYNSESDFAVILNTKEGDQVVLCSGINGTNYEEIWNDMQEKADDYDGEKTFTECDRLKVPRIEIDENMEYTELEGKVFYNADGNECEISQAIQTIKFELGEEGGKIKSEAGMGLTTTSIEASEIQTTHEYRYFYLDETFTMFLVEDGKDLPYFATTIDNITLFQD